MDAKIAVNGRFSWSSQPPKHLLFLGCRYSPLTFGKKLLKIEGMIFQWR